MFSFNSSTRSSLDNNIKLWDNDQFHNSDIDSNDIFIGYDTSDNGGGERFLTPPWFSSDGDSENGFESNNSLLNESGVFHIDINEDISIQPSVSTWVLVVLLICLAIITIIGNLLVCLSVILVRKLRKPQNYLLVSLAISDLFVGMFVQPFGIIFEFYQYHWPLNDGLCDLWVSADVLCCTASILNLCAISVDRYRSITSPLEYSSKATPKRMIGYIFVVWLLSACVSLPPVLLLGNIHQDPKGDPFCSVSQNFWYQIYATMASFYVPLCVMVVVYVKILRVVSQKKKEMGWKAPVPHPLQSNQSLHRVSSSTNNSNSTKDSSASSVTKVLISSTTANGGVTTTAATLGNNISVPNGGTNNKIKSTNKSTPNGTTTYFFPALTLKKGLKKEKLFSSLYKEHKASTTLGIIMSAFIISWVPFFILALIRPFLDLNAIEVPGWISSLFLWLGYFNSALNPIIYATFNRDFRKPFKEILCCRCSTLDTMMRRDFYNQQFGITDVEKRRISRLNDNGDATPVAL